MEYYSAIKKEAKLQIHISLMDLKNITNDTMYMAF